MITHKVINRDKESINRQTMLKKGLVPGIIYGKGTEPLKIAIEDKLLSKLTHEGSFFNKILNIDVDGKTEMVLPKEVQYHPVSEKLIHLDLQRVQGNTKVTVEVPVEFLNQDSCPGLKKGGVLNIVRRNIELICNANNIPEKLEFDLIDSDIGDPIKISQINLSEEVKPTISDRDFVVATLVPPTIEVETKPEEEETTEATDTPDAEGEPKTEDIKEESSETKDAKDKETKEEKKEDKK